MVIRMAQVKSLCTREELKLVEASRPPAVKRLTRDEVRRHAALARKHFDKWQGRSRAQARAARGRGKASTDAAKRSQKKVQVFRQVLDSFEARAAVLEADASQSGGKAAGSGQSKKGGSPHRAGRATVRRALAQAKTASNTTRRAKQSGGGSTRSAKVTAKATTAEPSKPEQPTAAAAATSPKAKRKKPTPRSTPASTGLEVSKSRQRVAVAAAKQERIDRTGLTSRVRGHVSARGRRTQARRDSKR